MIIYNDFKETDCLYHAPELRGKDFIVNNFMPSKECFDRLSHYCSRVFISIKLSNTDFFTLAKQARAIGFKHVAIDAENYCKTMTYARTFGHAMRELMIDFGFETIAVLPENLGGMKYKDYNSFLFGLRPDIVLMERLYKQPELWNIIFFYARSSWLRLIGAKLYIGIWSDQVAPDQREDQQRYARIISGDRIFWYSEKAILPL